MGNPVVVKYPCKECGALASPDNYNKSEIQLVMAEKQFCFACAFWLVRSQEKHELVIDHRIYGLGPNKKPGQYNGMGGRWFDIEFFDGRTVRTCDLWAGGEVPEKHREKIPNTARFLNGARAVKVGDTTCFQDSGATNA